MKHLKLRNRNGRMKSMAARRAGWISITLLFLLGLFLGTSNGLAAEPEVLGQKLSGSVEVGGRSVAGNTDSSKFNEYRDLKSGPFVDELKLNLDSKDGKRYFQFRTTDPAYRDQNYKLSLGSYNLYDVQFEFDQTPHVLSNTASTSYRYQGNGVFTLDDSKNGRVGAAGSGPLAARNTEGIDVSLDRWTGKFGFRYTPVPEWEFRLGFSSERQEGGRPMGLVVGSPGGSLTEVLEPIQYWTHGLSASAEYAREKYNLKFSYDLSLFRNDLDSVTWDYHLEAAPVGVPTVADPDRVRAALYPDNQAHRFSLSGGIHLPMKSRFVGTVSYSLMRQDQDLLPYTINSAIATPNGLPRSSADARANNFLLNLVLTNQAIRNLGLKAHFRYFNRENNTPSDRFFTVRTDSAAQSATGFLSNPQSFHDQSMELEGDWHLLRWATWKLAVERETSDNSKAEGRKLRENILKTSLNLRPAGWLQIRPSYRASKRKAGEYTAAGSELSLQRKFMEFDRSRQQAGLDVSVTPWDVLTFSLGSTYAFDDYPNTEYGLRTARVNTYTADVSYTPVERFSLFTNYAREEFRSGQKSRYRASGVDTIDNDWTSDINDTVDTVGVGADAVLIPEKLDAGVSYGISSVRTAQRTQNVGAFTTAAAQAFDWPVIKNRFTQIGGSLRYKPRKTVTAKVRYTYDKFREDDFTQDYLMPDMSTIDAGNASGRDSLFLGATAPGYTAHIVAVSLKLEF